MECGYSTCRVSVRSNIQWGQGEQAVARWLEPMRHPLEQPVISRSKSMPQHVLLAWWRDSEPAKIPFEPRNNLPGGHDRWQSGTGRDRHTLSLGTRQGYAARFGLHLPDVYRALPRARPRRGN